MRLFNVTFDKSSEIFDEDQLKNFINTAVLHNKDIAHFDVLEIDPRLTESQGFKIAQKHKFAAIYLIETQNGFTPFESVVSHIN